MKTFTRLAVLALALVCSTDFVMAQQSVRRPAPKAVSTAKKPVAKSATSQVRKPVTATTAPKTQTQAPAPVASPAAAETRQAPATQTIARPQPGARPAAARTYSTRSSHRSRAVYLNAGIGLATYYGGGLPLGVSVEVEAKNNFSIGGSIDYYRYNYGYYSSGYNFVYAGARASYHLGEALNVQNNSFDPYVGASLGFRYAGGGAYSYSYYDYGSSYNSGVFIGLHLGARFMFAPKVGAFAEVGYGVSAVKLGLTAKF
ncbi:hypothetical protein G8759_07355 [Spirosoma aureum]|uniref:Outer membrane beta-barrel protein n=1 Tax=Spirosoma aureum TaxID=2692134 RepID=A0A6G9AJU1_9BACT|nr:hypothetical protein [Spirosoma aureum]QIP12453.1 hypothetical protein G8759_07355 [Spirosoma aureum]